MSFEKYVLQMVETAVELKLYEAASILLRGLAIHKNGKELADALGNITYDPWLTARNEAVRLLEHHLNLLKTTNSPLSDELDMLRYSL